MYQLFTNDRLFNYGSYAASDKQNDILSYKCTVPPDQHGDPSVNYCCIKPIKY